MIHTQHFSHLHTESHILAFELQLLQCLVCSSICSFQDWFFDRKDKRKIGLEKFCAFLPSVNIMPSALNTDLTLFFCAFKMNLFLFLPCVVCDCVVRISYCQPPSLPLFLALSLFPSLCPSFLPFIPSSFPSWEAHFLGLLSSILDQVIIPIFHRICLKILI